MESIELGYFIEPPRAREKVKRAAKNIELDHGNVVVVGDSFDVPAVNVDTVHRELLLGALWS